MTLDGPREDGLSLIDGEFFAAPTSFDNVNPATEQVLGTATDCGTQDMQRAVEAARRAFDGSTWSRDPDFRKHCLEQLREGLLAEREHLRDVLVSECGTPVGLTRQGQLDWPIDELTYWADLAAKFDYDEPLPTTSIGKITSRREIWREPRGVVGAISAWNFPFLLNMAKIAPALASGCTVVLKPAPDTPWSATALARIAATGTDIPAGVFNVVTSADHSVGAALAVDPMVDLVTFTGSTQIGREVLRSGVDRLRPTVLELGGKSAAIVLDTASLRAGVRATCFGATMHAGQGCALTTRLLVQKDSLDEAIDLAREAMAAVRFGDPTDPTNTMGPLINDRQRRRVRDYIDLGRSEGPLLFGGGTPDELPVGFFVEPTLFGPVVPSARIAQEEIFGPVLVIIPFDNVDDAVTIANATPYGLSGAIFGEDEQRAAGVARQLRTGSVAINSGIFVGPDAPFGGYGQSGLGRENGNAGFSEFLETKTIGVRS